ncbi:MAG: transcription antitermination factor NusB [Dehalococcoidia bacterium]|nr:transcription antitermination factor NusB [Dehalococcoidia bacterium]
MTALVEGTWGLLKEIDTRLAGAASAWPLSQMARVDKSILRLAIYELLYCDDVPDRVAINEAIELAKVFGHDSSARFVNGVLGTIQAEKETADAATGGIEELRT